MSLLPICDALEECQELVELLNNHETSRCPDLHGLLLKEQDLSCVVLG